jgi:hypothetical protein
MEMTYGVGINYRDYVMLLFDFSQVISVDLVISLSNV